MLYRSYSKTSHNYNVWGGYIEHPYYINFVTYSISENRKPVSLWNMQMSSIYIIHTEVFSTLYWSLDAPFFWDESEKLQGGNLRPWQRRETWSWSVMSLSLQQLSRRVVFLFWKRVISPEWWVSRLYWFHDRAVDVCDWLVITSHMTIQLGWQAPCGVVTLTLRF